MTAKPFRRDDVPPGPSPLPQVSASAMSPARRRLIGWMRRIWYGRIERLQVRGGEPVLDPLPPAVCEQKFGTPCKRSSKPRADDCLLNDQVIEFLAYLDRLEDGVINEIEIWNGLPAKAIAAAPAA